MVIRRGVFEFMMIQRNPTSNKNQTPPLRGMHIYRDKKNRAIYYDVIFKKAYVITTVDTKTYTIYAQRFFIALALAVLVMSLSYEKYPHLMVVGPLLALLVYALMEWRFRSFLSTCSQIPVKLDEWIGKDELNASESKGRLITKTVLLLLLAILIVANAYISHFDWFMTLCCWAFGIGLTIASFTYIKALIYRSNHH